MRNERIVCIIATYLAKNLGCHIAIIQGDGYTEWSTGDKGFALLKDGTDWTPKQIAAAAMQHLYVAPVVVKKRKRDDEDDA